MIVLTIVQRKL